MYRVYELDRYISSFDNNYSTFTINSFVNGNNFKIGNVDSYGIEISINKGNYILDNVFYSKPYPTADFYNTSSAKVFNYKLNYKFNPLIYYSNGYLYYHTTDNSNSFDTALFSNGFSYKYDNNDYIIDGLRIYVFNDINGATNQNSFVINASGGSYYNDPTLDNYQNVNYSISNYSNSYYSFSDIESSFSSYKTANNVVKEITYSTGNFNNSLGSYFRDFINGSYHLYLGFYNNPLINKVSVAQDNSFDGLQRRDLTNIPNLSSFLGNKDTLVSQPLLLVQQDNNYKLSNSFYWIGNSDLSFYTRYLGKNDIRSIINDYGFDGTFNDTIESNWIIDFSGNLESITNVSDPVSYDGYGQYDFIEYNLTLPRSEKYFDSLDFSDLTFSNSLYFDSLSDISLSASGYSLEGLPVINFNDNFFLSSVFNGAMALSFGAITIGGLATAIFLFRGLVGLFRSNK